MPKATMDILRQLADLEKMIEDPPSFGPITWGLNREDIVMQISKIRASLPQELKNAASMVRESDRILEEARADATGILENARKESDRIQAEARTESDRYLEQGRLQQERMVSDSEILKLSKAQSDEIRASADRDALSMRRGAEKYTYDVLTQMESVLGKAMTAIERGKSEIAPDAKPLAPASREKARV